MSLRLRGPGSSDIIPPMSLHMSHFPVPARRSQALLPATALPVLAAVLLLLPSCGGGPKMNASLAQATALYESGQYAEALPLFEKAMHEGERSGTVLYLIGYCRGLAEGGGEAQRQSWKEAGELLEKEVADPQRTSLEKLYYLMRIKAAQDDFEAMRRYALQGVESFEKGPNPNSLSGEDWFRLGRLHDYLDEASPAEAAYRRAQSDFARKAPTNRIYHGLVLSRVAEYDFQAGRYDVAAEGFDRALAILPAGDSIPTYRHALALLAAGRFDVAVTRFQADRDPATMTESQYGADLARKASEAAVARESAPPQAAEDPRPFNDDTLTLRVKETAAILRKTRSKYSYKPGDPLSPELAGRQGEFVKLVIEWLIRKSEVQEFCLQQGIADLVRQ